MLLLQGLQGPQSLRGFQEGLHGLDGLQGFQEVLLNLEYHKRFEGLQSPRGLQRDLHEALSGLEYLLRLLAAAYPCPLVRVSLPGSYRLLHPPYLDERP